MKAILPEAFSKRMSDPNIVVLDTRSAADFVASFIPNSVFIGFSSPRFGEWAMNLIDKSHTLLLVASPGTENQVAAALVKAGFAAPEAFWKVDLTLGLMPGRPLT